jgi:hypothetical protein
VRTCTETESIVDRIGVAILTSAMLLVASSLSARADPQTSQVQASQVLTADQEASKGDENDPTRPVNSFDVRYRFEDASTTKQNDRQFVILRLNEKIQLAAPWVLGLRGDLPFTANNAISSSNPQGDYQAGLGRPLVQAYLAYIIDARWAFAIGTQVVAPAVSGSNFGSVRWDALPGGAVRYMLPELGPGSYFVPQLRYATSFAGEDIGRRADNLQFSPQLKIGLPEQWFVSLYPSPDIRVNFGDPLPGQTGRLFLPFDAMLGRKVTENVIMSLEVSVPLVRDYPVYRFKTEARLSLNF